MHARALASIDGAQLRGVFDVHSSASSSFAEKYSTTAYASVEELLADKSVNAVCVCTPSGHHASFAIMCAKAGKHIVIEKPMALTVSSADEVIAACSAHNVTGTVISQLRYAPDVERVRNMVKNGDMGRIVSAQLDMRYFRTQEYYDKSGWRGTWALDGGGALMNQGIHGVDALRYIMGSVETVSGSIKTL